MSLDCFKRSEACGPEMLDGRDMCYGFRGKLCSNKEMIEATARRNHIATGGIGMRARNIGLSTKKVFG